ncbi:MAG: polysaccharide biosynthesis/export family protein, partial [Candidatus Omnitrophota bacterium]|nr:polysaccharide biosynthesis/export family protein [Candidatus Omnitrophota bacterium]
MRNKFILAFSISLGLLISSLLSPVRAEEKLRGQPMQATAPAQTSTPVATLEKTPEKGGYTLAIPSNIPGYEAKTTPSEFDSVKYTLGPDDVIEVAVMRHPEFSGIFPINSEGKIQYKFVGDIDVRSLTKKDVQDKLVKILSSYLVGPEVSVTITEYRSKYVFVLGEVGQPGKYYIKSETISVRDAVVNSGLPT